MQGGGVPALSAQGPISPGATGPGSPWILRQAGVCPAACGRRQGAPERAQPAHGSQDTGALVASRSLTLVRTILSLLSRVHLHIPTW